MLYGRFLLIAAIVLALLGSEAHGTALIPNRSNMRAVSKEYGKAAAGRILAWMLLLKDSRRLPVKEKLARVNNFFNRLPNVSDLRQWHANDYWATPFELLIVNGGDCEDFVIAKYFSLRELKVPEQKMRITYVKSFMPDHSIVSHMVLSYYPCPQCDPLVLDNLTNSILPASKRKDLVPVFSFQGYDLLNSREKRDNSAAGGTTRSIPRWDDLLRRIAAQEKNLNVPSKK